MTLNNGSAKGICFSAGKLVNLIRRAAGSLARSGTSGNYSIPVYCQIPRFSSRSMAGVTATDQISTSSNIAERFYQRSLRGRRRQARQELQLTGIV